MIQPGCGTCRPFAFLRAGAAEHSDTLSTSAWTVPMEPRGCFTTGAAACFVGLQGRNATGHFVACVRCSMKGFHGAVVATRRCSASWQCFSRHLRCHALLDARWCMTLPFRHATTLVLFAALCNACRQRVDQQSVRSVSPRRLLLGLLVARHVFPTEQCALSRLTTPRRGRAGESHTAVCVCTRAEGAAAASMTSKEVIPPAPEKGVCGVGRAGGRAAPALNRQRLKTKPCDHAARLGAHRACKTAP